MPKGPRLVLENACYHIITRGNQKQATFLTTQDFTVFLQRLKKYKSKYGFWLYGFCLMPNHLHLIGEPKESKNLAKFMHGLLRSYTAYFNLKYKKVGHLWQDRFKSKIITKDRYLLDCIYYIEMNPVRANLVKSANEYEWSSYREKILTQQGEKTIDDINI